jgi:hypothetical protein
MLLAGRYAINNNINWNPIVKRWQEDYVKTHGSMPSENEAIEFLRSLHAKQALTA